MLQIRGLSHGSVANAITAAIDVLKVLQAQTGDPFAEGPHIAKLKNRRNKEQTMAERERQTAVYDDGTTILWEQVGNGLQATVLAENTMITFLNPFKIIYFSSSKPCAASG